MRGIFSWIFGILKRFSTLYPRGRTLNDAIKQLAKENMKEVEIATPE